MRAWFIRRRLVAGVVSAKTILHFNTHSAEYGCRASVAVIVDSGSLNNELEAI